MKTIKPKTREEMYLNRLAGGSGYVPKPKTREEIYIYDIIQNGGIPSGGGADMDGDGESDRIATDEEFEKAMEGMDDL